MSDRVTSAAREETVRVQPIAQASMAAGAVRSSVFGREHAVMRMHLAYDRSSGFGPDDQEGRYDRE